MDLGIAGKSALVCGASKGLGYGCALALVREGVDVLIVARGAEALDAAAARLEQAAAAAWSTSTSTSTSTSVSTSASGSGSTSSPTSTSTSPRAAAPKVQRLAADITTPEGRAAVFALQREFDIVVTNAGGPPPGDFRDWDRDAWIKAVDANMLTPIELIKATVDGMAARGFGRIVNITSSSVKAPIDILGLSNGARSGLTGFVAGVARSALAGQGVTINNLLPGAFDTDRLKGTLAGVAQKSGQDLAAVLEARKKAIPARRFGTPEEFGAICAFLCSVHAGYLNGQNVLADGGAYPGTY